MYRDYFRGITVCAHVVCTTFIYSCVCRGRSRSSFVVIYGRGLSKVWNTWAKRRFASDNFAAHSSLTCVSLCNALSPAERHKEMRKVEARRIQHESLSLAQSEQSIRNSTFGSVLSLDNTHCCGSAARTHRALQSISSGRFSRSQCVFTRNTRPPVLSTCTQYEHTHLVSSWSLPQWE